ncbi:MAG TPA: kelch repeat-containing protein [bacterium]
MTQFRIWPVLVAAAALAGCVPSVASTEIDSAFSGTWSEVQATGQNILSGAAAAIPAFNKIHMIGGSNGAAPVSNTWVYDVTADSWAPGPSLATGVMEAGYTVVNSSDIWLLGGADTSSTLTDIQTCAGVCPFGSGTWSTSGTPLPFQMERASAVTISGTIYLMGGSSSFPAPTDDNQIIDTTVLSITAGATLGRARYDHVAQVVGGFIYVIGGYDGANYIDRVDRYDPAMNTWSARNQLPIPLAYASAGVLNGRIYVVGGATTGDVTLNTLYVYTPATDTWVRGPDMPQALNHSAATVLNGRLYVIAGSTDLGNNPVNNTYVFTP